MDKLSHLIYRKRKDAGLTQEKLADLANVNRITIRRYENGDFKNLDFKQLFDISKILNFNLITYLSVYFEGLSMEEYSKLLFLHNMVIKLQKREVEAFVKSNSNDKCFKIGIGLELFCYAKALLETDRGDFEVALHYCYDGLNIDISTSDVKDMNNRSIIYLKLMVLAASCLLQISKYRRSEQIFLHVYNFIKNVDYKENIFRNQLFYTDFNEYKIVILNNLTFLYNKTNRYEKSILLCQEAINLMFQEKTFKFFYPIGFNKALSLYLLNRLPESKATLYQIYHYLIAVNETSVLEDFKRLISENMQKISFIISDMTEPKINE